MNAHISNANFAHDGTKGYLSANGNLEFNISGDYVLTYVEFREHAENVTKALPAKIAALEVEKAEVQKTNAQS